MNKTPEQKARDNIDELLKKGGNISFKGDNDFQKILNNSFNSIFKFFTRHSGESRNPERFAGFLDSGSSLR
jgi:hypothetical protein